MKLAAMLGGPSFSPASGCNSRGFNCFSAAAVATGAAGGRERQTSSSAEGSVASTASSTVAG
jgi:hypothetical protein